MPAGPESKPHARSATSPRSVRRRARSEAAADGGRLNAMGKAFSILEIVSSARQPLSMADIVRRTGLTKPTAHRITTLLSEMGFIERDGARSGFIEGPRLIALALSTLGSAAPRSLRHAVLRSVSEATGETCNFGILAGSEVVYLDRVEAKWPLGLRFEAGSRVPAHCTAIGKLLLSQLPQRERRAVIAAMPLARYTRATLTEGGQLDEALEAIAETRVGIDNQEFIDGVVCVSVPVMTDERRVIGGIAVSAPEARVSLDQALSFVPIMREAAARLGATFRLTGETDAG